MFLAQLAVSGAVWAATIFALVRRREALLGRAKSASRGARTASALLHLLASVVVLGLGMAALAAGGLTPRGLSWWGWPLITAVGAAFVVLQTRALVPLVLNAVTHAPSRSSDTIDTNRS